MASGGGKLQSTVGDAMLSYLKVYGYAALGAAGETEIRKNLARMWEEVALQQESAPIELKSRPSEEKKPGLLSSVLPAAPAVRKVAQACSTACSSPRSRCSSSRARHAPSRET